MKLIINDNIYLKGGKIKMLNMILTIQWTCAQQKIFTFNLKGNCWKEKNVYKCMLTARTKESFNFI